MRKRTLAALALFTLVAGCARSGDRRSDSASGTIDSSAAMRMDSGSAATGANAMLRRVAGKWNVIARPASGRDSTPTRVVLNATADTAGWTMELGGKIVALHVRVDGDSIIATSDEYSSARRPGVHVRTTSSHRLDGDRLVGTTVAHYSVKGADSVLVLNTTAARAP
jgi:hypothetical protein